MTTATERAIEQREKKSREAYHDRFPEWTPSERPEEPKSKKAKPAPKKS